MNRHQEELPRIGRTLVLASVATVGACIAWANWANIDQITRAPGSVIPSSRNQVIQDLDGGIVHDLLVKEGSVVKQGQVLIRFDRTKTESSFLESQARAASLKAAIARLNAEAGRAMLSPDVKDKLGGLGFEVQSSTPPEFGAFLRKEGDKWAKVVKSSGAKAE